MTGQAAAAPEPTDASAETQFRLGVKFASHAGDGHDYLQAAQWYRKAAAQNHPIAQFNLGMMYAQGQGVIRDVAAAMVWFLKAAHQGDAAAQFNLGLSFQRSSCAEMPVEAFESKVEAYKWYHLAAAQGYGDSAVACDRLSLTMSREAVDEGNHRAAAFVTEHPVATHAN